MTSRDFKSLQNLVKEGHIEKAIQEYEKIMEIEGNNLQVSYELAQLYARRGLISRVTDMYLNIADIYFNELELEKRLQVCNKIIEIEPESIRAREKIIEIYEKMGNKDEVREQCFSLSRICTVVGEVEKAMEYLKKGIEVDPDNLEACLELANMNVKQGYIKDSIQKYKEVAKAFCEREDFFRAAETYKRVTVIQPDDTESHLALGVIYRKIGKLEEAKQAFRFILRYDLNHTEALKELGFVCQEKGETDSAILAFKKISDINPENMLAREKLGDLYKITGHGEKAIENYISAAEGYFKEGKKDKAAVVCGFVTEIDRTNSRALRIMKDIVASKTSSENKNLKPGIIVKKAFDTSDMEEARTTKLHKNIIFEAEEREKRKLISIEKEKFDISNNKVSIEEIDDGSDIAYPAFVPEENDKVPGKEEVTDSVKIKDDKERDIGYAGETPESSSTLKDKEVQEDSLILREKEEIKDDVYLIDYEGETQEEAKDSNEEKQSEMAEIDEDEKLLNSKKEVEPGRLAILDEYRIKIKNNPQNIDIKKEFAGMLMKEGLLKEAVAEYEEILRLDEENISIYCKLIDIYNLLEKKDDLRDKYLSLGELYRRNQDYDSALDIYQRLLALNKDDIEAREHMIDILLVIEEKDRPFFKKQPLKEAIKNPDKLPVKYETNIDETGLLNNLAETLVKNGLLKEAVEEYEKILELDKENTDIYSKIIDIYNLMEDKKRLRKKYMDLAVIYIKKKDYSSSLDIFQRLIALNSGDIEARENMVDILLADGKKKEAIYQYIVIADIYGVEGKFQDIADIYEKMLKIDPEDLMLHMRLASLYIQLELKEKAIREYLLIGEKYLDKKLWNNAIEVYEKIAFLDPENVFIHEKLSDLYMKSGRSGKAISEILIISDVYIIQGLFDQAIEMVQTVIGAEQEHIGARKKLAEIYNKNNLPHKAEKVYFDLSEIFLKKNNIDKAIWSYEEILKLNKENYSIYYKLIDLYIMNGEIEKTVNNYLKVAQLLIKDNDYEEGIEIYKKVIKLDENNLEARYKMSILLKDKNIDGAIEELDAILKICPSHKEASRSLFELYLSIDDMNKAAVVIKNSDNKELLEEIIENYKKCLEKNPSDYATRYKLGLIYKELGELENAVEQYQALLKCSEKLLVAYNMLGLCFEQMGMANLAIKQYKKGISTDGYKDRDYLELKYNMALLYEKQGLKKDALSLYEEIIVVDIKYGDVKNRIEELKKG